MPKILTGKVVSDKLNNTVVVEVTRFVPHSLYKKLLKRSKKFKVETAGEKIEIGKTIKIIETRPLSKDKYFKVYSDDKKSKDVKALKAEKEVTVKVAKPKKDKKEKKA